MRVVCWVCVVLLSDTTQQTTSKTGNNKSWPAGINDVLIQTAAKSHQSAGGYPQTLCSVASCVFVRRPGGTRAQKPPHLAVSIKTRVCGPIMHECRHLCYCRYSYHRSAGKQSDKKKGCDSSTKVLLFFYESFVLRSRSYIHHTYRGCPVLPLLPLHCMPQRKVVKKGGKHTTQD